MAKLSMFTSMRNIFWLLLILVPTAVLGECPTAVLGECTCCDIEKEGRDKSLSFKYKMVAIASILVAGAVGVFLPVLGKWVPALRPERSFFFIIKAFAAGVILSTGFIHVLPDAFDSLSSPCLKEHPWRDFPFAGFVAMMAAIIILMVETWATARLRVKGGGDDEMMVHTHATHGHAHASLSLDPETQLHRYRVTSQVLELGIVIHSVIIGITLGASESPKTIKPLIAALTFHQFFEGMGLGGCITQAKFNLRAVIIMTFLFSITAPGGIAIGIGISNKYKETSPTALSIEGIFNSASAGILIYMALVDLLSADFMSSKMQSDGKLRLGANVSLLLGAGCMSLLAKWA